jgi:peptidoglycan/xylan/chitin deacetylase (PgdA/CDA1 family)
MQTGSGQTGSGEYRITWARVAPVPLLVLLLVGAGYWATGTFSHRPQVEPVAAPAGTTEPSPTHTPTLAPTATDTPTLTPSATPTDTETPTPTSTSTPTATATASSTPSATPTPTPTNTPTPTPLLPTPDGVERQIRVPILMYHHIDNAPPGAGAIRRDLSLPPEEFEKQLQMLKEEGYEAITLHDLALHLTVGKPLPPKPIALTFDDGYVDAYTEAFPLLERYGFVGTFFLVTKPIDDGNPDFLSWEQVKEMHAAGMRFEPHSWDHPDMRQRDYDFLVFQILAPKEAIEERTGETCRFFAYPSGRYDQFVIDVLRSAHFWGGVLTDQGATHTPDDLFELRRVRVRGEGDLAEFSRRLNLDW